MAVTRYRLEVTPTFYTLFLRLADTWFPLYAFPRDAATHQPKYHSNYGLYFSMQVYF